MSALLDFAVRATIVLVPALSFAYFSRRTSAAVRHAVCFVALAAVLVLPLLSAVLPEVGVAVLPAVESSLVAGRADSTGSIFVLGIWLGGAAVVTGRTLAGVFRARMLCRLAREVTDARVLTAAIRVRRDLGLTRPITILSQKRLGVPFTWGFVRPVVLLPAAAAYWGPSRLRAVLLHELTHIRRHDCLTQLAADLICAVYWFHPLVWLAASRMREERENACDDTVVVRGARPSGYATLLVRMVTAVRYGGLAAEPVAAFGGGRGLTGRLRVLLDKGRNRRALSPSVLAAFLAGALTLLLPLSVVNLTRAAPEPIHPAAISVAHFPETKLRPEIEAINVPVEETEVVFERRPSSAEIGPVHFYGFISVSIRIGTR